MSLSVAMAVENGKYGERLERIPCEYTTAAFERTKGLPPFEAWRSRHFLVQMFWTPVEGVSRMTVCRTTMDAFGRWRDGITWDELQRLKAECGHGDEWAVECYPPDSDLVNVANMRHLFLLPEPPDFGWVKGGRTVLSTRLEEDDASHPVAADPLEVQDA